MKMIKNKAFEKLWKGANEQSKIKMFKKFSSLSTQDYIQTAPEEDRYTTQTNNYFPYQNLHAIK